MVLEPKIGIVIIQGTVRLCERAGSAEGKAGSIAGKPVAEREGPVRDLGPLTGNPDRARLGYKVGVGALCAKSTKKRSEDCAQPSAIP